MFTPRLHHVYTTGYHVETMFTPPGHLQPVYTTGYRVETMFTPPGTMSKPRLHYVYTTFTPCSHNVYGNCENKALVYSTRVGLTSDIGSAVEEVRNALPPPRGAKIRTRVRLRMRE